MENFNDVADAFLGWTQAVSIVRSDPGTLDQSTGLMDPGATTSVVIQAVVQNATPEDLEVLPEGERTHETIKMHSTSPIYITDEDTGTTSDVTISYHGANWKVINVAHRAIGGYYKALAVKQ